MKHFEGSCPAITVRDTGILDYRSNTAPSGDIRVQKGGTLTFDNDSRDKTAFTNDVILEAGAAFSDVMGVCVPSGAGRYRFEQSSPDANIVLPKNYEYAPTAL